MSLDSQLEMIKSGAKSLAMTKYNDLSDDELTSIVTQLNVTIQATSSLPEAANLLGEVQGCVQLLKNRREARERIEKAKETAQEAVETWRFSTIRQKRKEAILNLPAGSGYPGQLVVAILEEEPNLTKEAIRGWADDLEKMEDAAYEKLLCDLVAENILSVNGEKYAVRNVCTPDLTTRWTGLTQEQRNVLNLIEENEGGITEYDWVEFTGDSFDLERMNKNLTREVSFPVLTELLRKGILQKRPIEGTKRNIFYITMLGEKGGASK